MSLKKIYSLLAVAFILSIISSYTFVNKYDSYEVSTDFIENHRMIKADIPSIWEDGEIIKRDIKSGKNYFSSGKEIFRSYLPPRLIAAYSFIFDYDLYEDWDEKIISSDSKKIYYLILQAVIYYSALLFFFRKISKLYPLRNCFFIMCFLAIEPTLFFFHSSFHTVSIYSSLQIIVLALMLDESNKKIKFIIIGLLLGIMFLQKIVTIYYILPISIYYIYKLKKMSFVPISLISIFYFLILIMVGLGNYKRAEVFYVMPPSSKITFHLYIPAEILSKGEQIAYDKADQKVKSDEKKWIKDNNINLESEIDRIKYYNYLQKYTFKVLLNYPLLTLRYVTWRTLQTAVLNPIYILEFFQKENAKKPLYYLEDDYKNLNLPLRVFYSILLYSVVIFGFFSSRKIIRSDHYILLGLSTLYMLAMLGWANNSRYFTPILIYLSIFFGHGLANINLKSKPLNS